MAVMNIGLARTKEAFQTNLGALATDRYGRDQDAVTAKAVMDTLTDDELITLAFTAQEAAYQRSAVNEMAANATASLANDAFTKFLRGVIGS